MLTEFSDKVIFYIMLLIGISMHEFGHAFAADKLGDPLPRLQGRVTINPIAHADLLGTFILPMVMIFSGAGILFGWGKPVQVSLPNPKTRMRDDLLSTAAGPLMNFILAIISASVVILGKITDSEGLMKVGWISLLLNCMLLVFNMLPVPPLDGSHFLRYALKMNEAAYAKFSQAGFVILLALIFLTPFGQWLSKAIYGLATLLINAAASIADLFISIAS